MSTKRLAAVPIAALALSLLAGCAGPAAAPAPTLDILNNAEYQTDVTPAKLVKLAAGKYEAAAAPGSASKVTVTLLSAPLGTGDLNADGSPDAAVIIAANTGGSGTFISLHAMLSDKGAVKDAAWVALGDRVSVKSVVVSAGVITINMIKHGPNDPLCCPTQDATVKYKLQDGKLVTVP